MTATILVIGATYLDTCFAGIELPSAIRPTTFADDAVTCFGGKGYNQAVGARRLGAEVTFVSAVGGGDADDPMSGLVSVMLKEEGFAEDDLYLQAQTGCRLPPVSVVSNSNDVKMLAPKRGQVPGPPLDLLRGADVGRRIAAADVVLMTYDYREPVLQEVLNQLIELGENRPALVVNPAPDHEERFYVRAPQMRRIDWLVPNEREAKLLLTEQPNDRTTDELARDLADIGIANVVVTAGEHGSVYADRRGRTFHIPSFSPGVVDTTAASDAYCAALAVAIAEGADARAALTMATAAAACACERLGTSVAMPHRSEVRAFLHQQQLRSNCDSLLTDNVRK